MMQRARTYLEHMEELFSKVPCTLALSVEQVALFGEREAVPEKLRASDFF